MGQSYAAQGVGAQPASPPATPHPGTVVMVVDPDPGVRRIIALVLEEAGCVTHPAPTGEDALARLAEWQPALVIAEVRLPGMDGVELAGAIRDRGGRQPVIVLMSAYPKPQEGRADAFLAKPLRFEALLDIAREAGTLEA